MSARVAERQKAKTRVTVEGQIEGTKAITGQRVSAALENDGTGAEPFHHATDNLRRGEQQHDNVEGSLIPA